VVAFLAVLALLGAAGAACAGWWWLLPLRRLNGRLAGPDAELQRAVAAARRGGWEPAARLLEVTGRDWERRSLYAKRLGHLAAWDGDDWLRDWQDARPDDPDAAVVRARCQVDLAWKLRGAKRATHTSREKFDGFHRELFRSREPIAVAAQLNPDDPTPYVTEIWTALGLGYCEPDMAKLWEGVSARAPQHFEGHCSALQYWCGKWRGSAKLARDFAGSAAAGAPSGSLLTALPLIAWYEHHDGSLVTGSYTTPQVRALVDATLADAAAADDHHPRLPEVRHLLAHFLLRQGRCREALRQFRAVDGYVDALPWRYRPFPRLAYRTARTRAARGALREALVRR
jgi:hypothetical protein